MTVSWTFLIFEHLDSILVRYFVGCPHLECVWCFSHDKTENIYRFFKGNHSYPFLFIYSYSTYESHMLGIFAKTVNGFVSFPTGTMEFRKRRFSNWNPRNCQKKKWMWMFGEADGSEIWLLLLNTWPSRQTWYGPFLEFQVDGKAPITKWWAFGWGLLVLFIISETCTQITNQIFSKPDEDADPLWTVWTSV